VGPVALAQDGPVYLDAQVLIYAVEGREPFAEQLMPLWQAVDRGELAGVTSELTWLEVLVHPLRHHDREREEQFRQALRHPHLVVRPITTRSRYCSKRPVSVLSTQRSARPTPSTWRRPWVVAARLCSPTTSGSRECLGSRWSASRGSTPDACLCSFSAPA